MGKRLDYTKLAAEYPNRGQQTYRELIPLRALLQKNYGERLDCTITSMACIFGEGHYSEIEAIARKYGYDGEKYGTNPLTVRRIMRDFLQHWNMPGKPRSAYGKGVGWNFSTIKHLIHGKAPVVLNLWDDGRGYYHDHSVTIIGAEEYERARFLIVLDNWNASMSLIDYKKLSVISSINWVEK